MTKCKSNRRIVFRLRDQCKEKKKDKENYAKGGPMVRRGRDKAFQDGVAK